MVSIRYCSVSLNLKGKRQTKDVNNKKKNKNTKILIFVNYMLYQKFVGYYGIAGLKSYAYGHHEQIKTLKFNDTK